MEEIAGSIGLHRCQEKPVAAFGYVPQLFVVSSKWNEWKPQADLAKLIEEKFPFEKLQAMIDK